MTKILIWVSVWNEILISVSVWLKNPDISIGMILVWFRININVSASGISISSGISGIWLIFSFLLPPHHYLELSAPPTYPPPSSILGCVNDLHTWQFLACRQTGRPAGLDKNWAVPNLKPIAQVCHTHNLLNGLYEFLPSSVPVG